MRGGIYKAAAAAGANQQANKTSCTDGAHANLSTAQLCIYSLISPVSGINGVMGKQRAAAGLNRTRPLKTTQAVGNHWREGFTAKGHDGARKGGEEMWGSLSRLLCPPSILSQGICLLDRDKLQPFY